MPRLLYLHPGLVPPPENPRLDKFFYISDVLEGEVLTPVWWKDEAEAKDNIGARFPMSQCGRFRHHLFAAVGYAPPVRTLAKLAFFVRKGLELHREKPFDYVMTYGTNGPGIAGMILKLLTGAKLIPELPNVPHHQYRFTEPHFTFFTRVKKWLSDILLHLVIWYSDVVKLLYPTQLQEYPLLRRRRSIVFHDLVPVDYIAMSREGNDGKTVLLLGYPWFTKGVDIAIRAFRKIASQFPVHRLTIVSHITDRRYLDELIGDCRQIDIQPAVPGPEALKLISSCAVYLSASRTEGIARVLLEAMSAARPVVASAVGGTPHLVQDDECGLLFASQDADALAAQLTRILGDPALAARLGQAAYRRVTSAFDEKAYVEQFRRMVAMLEKR
jgi:glycosyltransferase involved in cell wall biosynthesis